MTTPPLAAVYDFQLMPYALGDVLTWNVQTAIRCEQLGRSRVDVHICMDPRSPASIYQKGTITAENCGLFFNEVFGAFGTHPYLGNLHFYTDRNVLLSRLADIARGDSAAAEPLEDYARALASDGDKDALVDYFTKYIYFHEGINAFWDRHGRIPLLQSSLGCAPDIEGLVENAFAGRKIVAVHMRLRRLDAGYGGEHTYTRDSDFLEWYEFLREAGTTHPEVQFVALGRLQEKPIEMLRLPNVMSLRTLGLGLGHELTLMLHSDLFIGTSSGFAAMANFSELPYFITRMNDESCNAYRIPKGCSRLPFATPRQTLVYEPETASMLSGLLENGLGAHASSGPPRRPASEAPIYVRDWRRECARRLYPGATTNRYFMDDDRADRETTLLLWPRVLQAMDLLRQGAGEQVWILIERMEKAFPRAMRRFHALLHLKTTLARKFGTRSSQSS